MSESQKEIRKHSFQPGAMSIIQMGEELIGHPSTAINELVKNGYDADALMSQVYFHYSSDPVKAFVIIFDNGNGMDNSVLFGDWLKPSISSKRKSHTHSAIYKRQYLGSKGIGRLAAMALGKRVNVISKTNNDDLYNWITIDRDAFRDDNLLSNVIFPGDIINDYILLFHSPIYLKEREVELNSELIKVLESNDLSNFSSGTLIIIEELDKSVLKILERDFITNRSKELFDDNSLKNTDFFKSLATLVTPLVLNEKIQDELIKKKIIENKISISKKNNSFSVKFGSNLISDQNEYNIEWQEITSIPIMSIFDYRIYGKVTKEGNVSGFLNYNRIAGDELEEKILIPRSEIFNDSVFGNLDLFGDENLSETPEAGEYYFDIRVYDIGERDNLEKLANLSKFENVTKFRQAFKNFQGLRVSKNGFGVKPYGEEVEDWIGLSKERVQNPGQNVNTNQILGYVFFYSPENDNLQEKTNREGFLANKAFLEVKETLANIFKNLGRKRYNYRLLHGLGRVPTSKHSRPDFETFLDKIKTNPNIEDLKSYSEKFIREVTTSMDNLEESLSFSERLASLGSGIELVYHEMAQPISGLRTTKSSLDLKRDKISAEAKEFLISDINTLSHSTDVLVDLRESLQPAIGKSRKRKFKPSQTFRKVCNLFKADCDENGIIIKLDENLESYELIDVEYAFWVAFLNIINNAVYWIKKSEKSGEIRLFLENDSLVVSNSGPLISEGIIDYIFNYGVTTRQEKNATGLGLAFTQSILSKNNWAITADNRKNGPAFTIKKLNDE